MCYFHFCQSHVRVFKIIFPTHRSYPVCHILLNSFAYQRLAIRLKGKLTTHRISRKLVSLRIQTSERSNIIGCYVDMLDLIPFSYVLLGSCQSHVSSNKIFHSGDRYRLDIVVNSFSAYDKIIRMNKSEADEHLFNLTS